MAIQIIDRNLLILIFSKVNIHLNPSLNDPSFFKHRLEAWFIALSNRYLEVCYPYDIAFDRIDLVYGNDI